MAGTARVPENFIPTLMNPPPHGRGDAWDWSPEAEQAFLARKRAVAQVQTLRVVGPTLLFLRTYRWRTRGLAGVSGRNKGLGRVLLGSGP